MKEITSRRKLLILDLDETLLYATEEPLERQKDFRVEQYYVYLRPHLKRFLEFCLTRFEVAVWTSSTEDYAAEMVFHIFPSPNALSFLWARSRCTRRFDFETREDYWLKDLKKIKRKGFALEQVVVIDDTSQKYARNYGNLILVREFTGDPNDDELLRLENYLGSISDAPNIRRLDKRQWRA